MNEEVQRFDYLPEFTITDGQEGETVQPAVYPTPPLPDPTGDHEQNWNLIRGEELR